MITIWTGADCIECERALNLLRQSGLVYEVRDTAAIAEDPDRDDVQAQLALQGMSLPILRAEDGFFFPRDLGARIAAALTDREEAS
jgi:arsenate reductase-like glutaredoxin family protein